VSFAQEIRELRVRKGWTAHELARAVCATPGYISKIEVRGVIPSPEMIIKLAGVLDGDAAELFELAKGDKIQEVTQSVERRYNNILLRKGGKNRGEVKSDGEK